MGVSRTSEVRIGLLLAGPGDVVRGVDLCAVDSDFGARDIGT
jgi:hypothetical protein